MSTLGHWYSSFTLGTKNEEKSKRFNHFFFKFIFLSVFKEKLF